MTTDFLPTWTPIWILYFPDPRDLEKKTRASNNNTMEDYEYKVSNLHAILSYDYQQIGNISKTTSEFTSESGRRRFLPREQQLFSGDASRCFLRLVFGDQGDGDLATRHD